jgi:hypothetical protein
MARPSTETESRQHDTEPQEPEPSIKTTSKQTIRRESYIAGEPDSAPELVRFMTCKSKTDIENIAMEDLLIAATQVNQTVSGWEVTIMTLNERINQLEKQNKDQQGIIEYLEQRHTASTSSPAPLSSKSMKIPDPEPLSDGKSPIFENWKIQIEGKFIVNHDYFPIEQAKMIYVFGRTTGDAQTHLRPRYGTDEDPFSTSQDMIAFLANIYLDPFKVKNAR